MKKFRRGQHTENTMTVDELIEALRKCPADSAVLLTWEGTVHGIRVELIEQEDRDGMPVVYLDAEC